MKYSLTFLMAFSLLTSMAQPVTSTSKPDADSFTLTKQLIILLRSDSIILKSLKADKIAKIDTVVSVSTDSASRLITILNRWGVDTTEKDFDKLRDKLRINNKVDISNKILSSDTLVIVDRNLGNEGGGSNDNKINLTESAILVLIGIVCGFIFFVLLRWGINRKKKNSNNKPVTGNMQPVESPGSEAPTGSAPKQEQTGQIILYTDILVELKKRKIEIPKKGTINDLAKKLLATLSELEKKQDEDLKTLEGLQEEKGQFENEKLNLTNQIAQIQEQVKQLTIEKTDLTDKMRSLKELAAQDEQVVFKALVWINRADDDIHNQISQGDVRGANQRLVSSALNGLLLFQSYLEYRRKLSRTSSKDVAPPTQKSVEMDANLRILMGEQVDLKQPGPGISDAPPLTSHLREVAKEHGITEITPFGYDGYKIKS